MKDKKNPLEKFLDQKIVLNRKQLGALIIFCLGIGALTSIVSSGIGVILVALMLFALVIITLPYVMTSKGAP